jgi:hypothetical protein
MNIWRKSKRNEGWGVKMEIRKIQGATPNLIRMNIEREVEETRFTCEVRSDSNKVTIHNVRLREAKPYCGNHPNACEIGGADRKMKYLEGVDWVSFNDFLNDILDDMEVSASIVSSRIVWIRKGNKRRICYGSHQMEHSDFYIWDYQGEEEDYENWCGKEAPDSIYPLGTPGEYTREDIYCKGSMEYDLDDILEVQHL